RAPRPDGRPRPQPGLRRPARALRPLAVGGRERRLRRLGRAARPLVLGVVDAPGEHRGGLHPRGGGRLPGRRPALDRRRLPRPLTGPPRRQSWGGTPTALPAPSSTTGGLPGPGSQRVKPVRPREPTTTSEASGAWSRPTPAPLPWVTGISRGTPLVSTSATTSSTMARAPSSTRRWSKLTAAKAYPPTNGAVHPCTTRRPTPRARASATAHSRARRAFCEPSTPTTTGPWG